MDPAKRLRDAGQFEQRGRHRRVLPVLDQIRNCSSIHSMPSALSLVTTGPSVTMFLGMSVPLLAPLITAETPAMTAPPWMRHDGLRTVANISPPCTALIPGRSPSPPPLLLSVRHLPAITLPPAS